jgi:hypothetical protein
MCKAERKWEGREEVGRQRESKAGCHDVLHATRVLVVHRVEQLSEVLQCSPQAVHGGLVLWTRISKWNQQVDSDIGAESRPDRDATMFNRTTCTRRGSRRLTVHLYPEVDLRVRWMRCAVSTKLDLGTTS